MCSTVEVVYYQNTSTLTPSAVKLDDDNVYQLNSTEIQFIFSAYSSVKVGNHVALIYQISLNGTVADSEEGSQKLSIINYVEP